MAPPLGLLGRSSPCTSPRASVRAAWHRHGFGSTSRCHPPDRSDAGHASRRNQLRMGKSPSQYLRSGWISMFFASFVFTSTDPILIQKSQLYMFSLFLLVGFQVLPSSSPQQQRGHVIASSRVLQERWIRRTPSRKSPDSGASPIFWSSFSSV